MKKNSLLLFLFLILTINCLSAQDLETEAMLNYSMAELAYNEKNYQDALQKLKEAEKVLGTTNSEVLYLKAKSLNKLVLMNSDLEQEFENTLKSFFETVNKETFPFKKYSEIHDLNLDWRELKAHLSSEEYQRYKKIINSPKPESASVENYTKQFPNSNYIKELQNDLIKKTYVTLTFEEQKLQIKNAFEKISNAPKLMTCGQLNNYITELQDYSIVYPINEYSSAIDTILNISKKRKEEFLTLAHKYCSYYSYKRDNNSRNNFCLETFPIFDYIIKIRSRNDMKKIEATLKEKAFLIDDLKITPCKQFE